MIASVRENAMPDSVYKIIEVVGTSLEILGARGGKLPPSVPLRPSAIYVSQR
jgi:hypothetical protein